MRRGLVSTLSGALLERMSQGPAIVITDLVLVAESRVITFPPRARRTMTGTGKVLQHLISWENIKQSNLKSQKSQDAS